MEDCIFAHDLACPIECYQGEGACKHNPASRLGERIGGLERTGLAKT